MQVMRERNYYKTLNDKTHPIYSPRARIYTKWKSGISHQETHPLQYPVKSKNTSQIPGIEHMNINEMFDGI